MTVGQIQWISRGRIQVTLTQDEQTEAAKAGWARHKAQRSTGRVDFKSRPEDDGVLLDIRGALAEQAVAVALNLPWDGKFKPIEEWDFWRREGHDVSGLEVKSTKRSNGSLILHESSQPELPAVLAIVESKTTINLVGWCYTKDGQHAKHWREDVPRACFMVGQGYLRPMAELMKLLGQEVPQIQDQDITAEELERLLSA